MEKNIVQYTVQIILVSLIEKVIFILVAFYKPDHRLAILGMTIGYLLLAAVILGMKRNALKPIKGVPKETTLSILKFALPYVPVLVLSWLNNSTPLLVLKRHVDYTAVGIYTNAVTIANILHLVQTGFSTYWNPFIYEYYKDEKNKEKIARIERLVVFVLIVTAISIILFQDVIYLLVGSKFRASKVFFPFLMLTPICNCIADMTGAGIMLSKKSYLNIFTFLGSTSVNLMVSLLLVPRIGIMGAGIAVGLSANVMLLIRSFLGGKYYKISTNNRFIVYALGYMVIACVVNMGIANNKIRYVLISLLLLGVCLLFQKEIQYCVRFIRRELQTIDKRREK
ncbi:MAG: lipopolysaccharide biosynthesis protein [Lawsonibacter sp.]|nr:lipopolysaccharide biosynthesis protein [Lawsonibacter sp.]